MQEIQDTWVQSLGQEDSLKEGMATDSSILKNSMLRGAWWATVHKVARVGHDSVTNTHEGSSVLCTVGRVEFILWSSLLSLLLHRISLVF